MKKLFLLLAMLSLSACATAIISDDGGHHVLVDVHGRGQGIWDDAKAKANGRCAQYGKVAANPMKSDPGWFDVAHWYIQYDCVNPPTPAPAAASAR